VDLTKQDDRRLIDLSLEGSDAAFRILVERYEQQVAGTVIGMLGPGDDADDVGQEVFIRFYRSLNRFRNDSGLGTYLTRIAINLSLNEIKRQKRNNTRISREGIELPLEDKVCQDNEQANDAKELVCKALQKLEPKFRSVVILRMLHGYSTKETASILKLPSGTILSRLSRAQEKLKVILNKLM
jgi:RNA polymerase sigma-70 factor (ECF subfamily)